jgi:hypothetical protein
MKYWLRTPCMFCTEPLKNTKNTDAMYGCHGWRMHTDCLKKISELRDEYAIINFRRQLEYIHVWVKDHGQFFVYA